MIGVDVGKTGVDHSAMTVKCRCGRIWSLTIEPMFTVEVRALHCSCGHVCKVDTALPGSTLSARIAALEERNKALEQERNLGIEMSLEGSRLLRDQIDRLMSEVSRQASRVASLEAALRRVQVALAQTSPAIWKSLKVAVDAALSTESSHE